MQRLGQLAMKQPWGAFKRGKATPPPLETTLTVKVQPAYA
jgi:hypothetical protein